MSYSCNDNQNYFVSEGNKTTSRVLNPPGGKTSISLGYEGTPATTKKEVSKAEEPKEQPQKQEEDPKPKTQSTLPNKSFVEPKEETKAALAAALPGQNADQPVSANAFASGANINGAQVMTGRSTSRVLAPPGGHTSIQLG